MIDEELRKSFEKKKRNDKGDKWDFLWRPFSAAVGTFFDPFFLYTSNSRDQSVYRAPVYYTQEHSAPWTRYRKWARFMAPLFDRCAGG